MSIYPLSIVGFDLGTESMESAFQDIALNHPRVNRSKKRRAIADIKNMLGF